MNASDKWEKTKLERVRPTKWTHDRDLKMTIRKAISGWTRAKWRQLTSAERKAIIRALRLGL